MYLFDVYRNRDVFVTGHTGFKGAWLCLWLSELGARVHGYSLEPPTMQNWAYRCSRLARVELTASGVVKFHTSSEYANALM